MNTAAVRTGQTDRKTLDFRGRRRRRNSRYAGALLVFLNTHFSFMSIQQYIFFYSHQGLNFSNAYVTYDTSEHAPENHRFLLIYLLLINCSWFSRKDRPPESTPFIATYNKFVIIHPI